MGERGLDRIPPSPLDQLGGGARELAVAAVNRAYGVTIEKIVTTYAEHFAETGGEDALSRLRRAVRIVSAARVDALAVIDADLAP